jgi:cell division protein FtsZ
VEEALSSPLLNNNDIEGACNLLLYISSGRNEITMDEVTEITDYIQNKTKNTAEVIWGNGFDESLDDKISVTIIATGFDEEHRASKEPAKKSVTSLYDQGEKPAGPSIVQPIPEPVKKNAGEIITRMTLINKAPEPPKPHVTEPEPMLAFEPEPVFEKQPDPVTEPDPLPEPVNQREIVFDLDLPPTETIAPRKDLPQADITEPVQITGILHETPEPEAAVSFTMKVAPAPAPQPTEIQDRRSTERVSKLRALSEKLKGHTPIEHSLPELEAVPAYKRRNVELADVPPSSESSVPRLSLSGNGDGTLEVRTENSFLHNNVD